MLHALLKCASRTMWQAHRCPLANSARALAIPDLVSLRTLSCSADLRDCNPSRGIATVAPMAGPHSLHGLQGRGAPSPHGLHPSAAGAHRRQYAHLAVQAQSADGLQRAIFAGRHKPPVGSSAYRHRFGGGVGASDSGRSFHWQPPGQLSAAQNFSIWNGSHDRRQMEGFQTCAMGV